MSGLEGNCPAQLELLVNGKNNSLYWLSGSPLRDHRLSLRHIGGDYALIEDVEVCLCQLVAARRRTQLLFQFFADAMGGVRSFE